MQVRPVEGVVVELRWRLAGGGGGGIEPPGAGGGAGADDALSTGPPAEMLAAGAGADCASTRLKTAVVDT